MGESSKMPKAIFTLVKMVESYFVKFLTSPIFFEQKLLSVFFRSSEFTELTFCWIVLAGKTGYGIFCKDPKVWLDGVRPNNNSFPPSFLEKVPGQPHGVPAPKNTFARVRN